MGPETITSWADLLAQYGLDSAGWMLATVAAVLLVREKDRRLQDQEKWLTKLLESKAEGNAILDRNTSVLEAMK